MSGPSPRSTRAPRWPAVAMVVCWLAGIAWIVLFYVDPTLPVLSALGNANLLVGIVLFGLGWVFLAVFVTAAVVTARRR
ncbi:cell division protein CrgA [Nonomuraea sp. MCN248]|uniref:Cell division protein CrgA n=1 Tax=Nonomuraea corallina TaxID=2989783 RepID=A0ABT4SJE3_9ACTN|nr:cell division protein CrgA [Nonomuraea corallina]MDA0637337.1 cell division protein CrgA [Nonomuraea corallina]